MRDPVAAGERILLNTESLQRSLNYRLFRRSVALHVQHPSRSFGYPVQRFLLNEFLLGGLGNLVAGAEIAVDGAAWLIGLIVSAPMP